MYARNGVSLSTSPIETTDAPAPELAVDEYGNCPPLKPNAAG
jgi:hypothetical protein